MLFRSIDFKAGDLMEFVDTVKNNPDTYTIDRMYYIGEISGMMARFLTFLSPDKSDDDALDVAKELLSEFIESFTRSNEKRTEALQNAKSRYRRTRDNILKFIGDKYSKNLKDLVKDIYNGKTILQPAGNVVDSDGLIEIIQEDSKLKPSDETVKLGEQYKTSASMYLRDKRKYVTERFSTDCDNIVYIKGIRRKIDEQQKLMLGSDIPTLESIISMAMDAKTNKVANDIVEQHIELLAKNAERMESHIKKIAILRQLECNALYLQNIFSARSIKALIADGRE